MNKIRSSEFILLEDSLIAGFWSESNQKSSFHFNFHLILGLILFVSKPRASFALTKFKIQNSTEKVTSATAKQ